MKQWLFRQLATESHSMGQMCIQSASTISHRSNMRGPSHTIPQKESMTPIFTFIILYAQENETDLTLLRYKFSSLLRDEWQRLVLINPFTGWATYSISMGYLVRQVERMSAPYNDIDMYKPVLHPAQTRLGRIHRSRKVRRFFAWATGSEGRIWFLVTRQPPPPQHALERPFEHNNY